MISIITYAAIKFKCPMEMAMNSKNCHYARKESINLALNKD